MMSSQQLTQAHIAIQSGDKALARIILKKLILENPRNEQAWLLMAQAVEKRDQSIDCLEQVLKINPNNPEAKSALSVLKRDRQRASSAPTTSVQIATTLGPDTPTKAAPKDKTTKKQAEGKTLKDAQKRRPRLAPNWSLIFGVLMVCLIIIIAAFGPTLAPKDPLEENVIVKVGDDWEIPPFGAFTVPGFILGSDQFGRDLLSRVLWAIRPTLIMVLIVALVRLFLGTIIGLGAGWSKGRTGQILDTLISGALSVPVLLVALIAIAVLGSELGLLAFVIGLSINGWGETARVVREQTRAISGTQYIEAARALGSSTSRILSGHVLRQIMPMIWMLFAFEISSTLLVTAGLGFLGYYIGGDVWIEVGDFVSRRVSGMPELGQMLATSWTTLTEPWPMVLTGTIIFITVLGFNLLGEGLRILLQPERATRNIMVTRALNSFTRWFEERITYPTGVWLKANALRVGFASVVLVAAGSSLYWWQSQTPERIGLSGTELVMPSEDLWRSERGNPYGTRWNDWSGPTDPQIQWTLEIPDGYAGGPAVATDGSLYLGTNDGRLLAVSPDGDIIWETELPATPVGPPALNDEGDIYIGDEEGGMIAVSAAGDVIWQFEQDDVGLPIHGPTVDLEGDIYYLLDDPRGDHLISLTSEGELRWSTETGTRNANTAPRLSPDGDDIFVKDQVISTKDGEVEEILTPLEEDPVLSGREQIFVGADGNTYIQSGHIVILWQYNPSKTTLEIVQSAEWNYQAAGYSQHSSFPKDAGVTYDQTVWLFYSWMYGGTRIIWTDITGHLLGISNTRVGANGLLTAMDNDDTAYICGVGPVQAVEPKPMCMAYLKGSVEPLWELDLESAVGGVTGGAFAPGTLYVTTEDGYLFALSGGESIERVSQPASGDTAEEQSESPAGTPTPQAPQIAWQYQVPGPFDRNLYPQEDGSVYVLTESNNLLVISPEGELLKEIPLKAGPYFDTEEGHTLPLFTYADGVNLIISSEDTVYAIDSEGNVLWEEPLAGKPVGWPAMESGYLYISDKSGTLYAFTEEGIQWSFKAEEAKKSTTAPTVGPDGTIYYTVIFGNRAYIQAVTPTGEPLWATQVRTGYIYDWLKINALGTLLFLNDDIFDTREGRLLDVEPPVRVDDYIMGEDGLTYLRSGHTVAQWQLTEEGIEIVQTAAWDSKGYSQYPEFMSQVGPNQVIWMYRFTRSEVELIWLNLEGEVLGAHRIPLTSRTIFWRDYRNTQVTVCNAEMGTDKLNCMVLEAGTDRPIWEATIEGIPDYSWGFLAPEGIFAITRDNVIYKVDIELPSH
jgi:ABC-type dipeptide/oligopeptide/nickel transport system permease subunit